MAGIGINYIYGHLSVITTINNDVLAGLAKDAVESTDTGVVAVESEDVPPPVKCPRKDEFQEAPGCVRFNTCAHVALCLHWIPVASTVGVVEGPLPELVGELVGGDLLEDLYPMGKERQAAGAGGSDSGTEEVDLGVYPMTTYPRGVAIIINNEHFEKMPSRPGTEKDGKALQHLFTHLGFNTALHRDLKADAMRKTLSSLAERDHSLAECLVVAILSHGEEGGMIHGKDDVLINIKELTNLFSGQSCPTLAGKPKLFFIQACRGKEFDLPVVAKEATDYHSASNELEETVDGVKKSLLPDQADFLLSFSTAEGYVSWRNSAFGSWYVKALVETMHEHAAKEHLVDILTEVNRRVAENQSQSGFRQIPAVVNQLRKQLYFNPSKHSRNLLNRK